MRQFKTLSDVGCIKFFTDETAFYFSNDYGDGENSVKIYEEKTPEEDCKGKFLNSFDVKTPGTVHLSNYDCSPSESLFTFQKPGRYFVYLVKPCHFQIRWFDDRI
jgi:hypothetical protein